MGRLPFDPRRMAAQPAAQSAAPGGPGAPLRVRDLCAMISGALERGTPRSVRVVGEVSGFKDNTHWYFCLKDAEARVDCVMFQSAARRAGFTLRNGQEVIAGGQVRHFAQQGRTQLYVDRLEPVGAGALDLKFRQLCEEIRALGWFAEDRKRALPVFPGRVAVVTSSTGADYQDVLDTMRRRCPAVEVLLADVRVQGEGAAAEVAAALGRISREHERLGVDAVIVTRGGGSMEDLWTFNERSVAAAIVACAVPVVAAIGHETDVTIAELVADMRAATPTQAAMRVTPDREALAQQVARGEQRLSSAVRGCAADAGRRLESAERAGRSAVRHRLADARVGLERAAGLLARCRPEAEFARRSHRVSALEMRLARAVRDRMRTVDLGERRARLDACLRAAVSQRAQRLDGLHRALELASPVNVLRRGYSVTMRADGRLVRSPSDVRPGDTIDTRLADGSVRSVVEGERASRGPSPVRRPGREEPEGGLFQ